MEQQQSSGSECKMSHQEGVLFATTITAIKSKYQHLKLNIVFILFMPEILPYNMRKENRHRKRLRKHEVFNLIKCKRF